MEGPFTAASVLGSTLYSPMKEVVAELKRDRFVAPDLVR
jgi:hypothetical protein